MNWKNILTVSGIVAFLEGTPWGRGLRDILIADLGLVRTEATRIALWVRNRTIPAIRFMIHGFVWFLVVYAIGYTLESFGVERESKFAYGIASLILMVMGGAVLFVVSFFPGPEDFVGPKATAIAQVVRRFLRPFHLFAFFAIWVGLLIVSLPFEFPPQMKMTLLGTLLFVAAFGMVVGIRSNLPYWLVMLSTLCVVLITTGLTYMQMVGEPDVVANWIVTQKSKPSTLLTQHINSDLSDEMTLRTVELYDCTAATGCSKMSPMVEIDPNTSVLVDRSKMRLLNGKIAMVEVYRRGDLSKAGFAYVGDLSGPPGEPMRIENLNVNESRWIFVDRGGKFPSNINPKPAAHARFRFDIFDATKTTRPPYATSAVWLARTSGGQAYFSSNPYEGAWTGVQFELGVDGSYVNPGNPLWVQVTRIR